MLFGDTDTEVAVRVTPAAGGGRLEWWEREGGPLPLEGC